MNLSPEQIRWIFVYLFVLIISVALHEFGHAFMATKLGDDTPRRQGRVTLNPLAHADPIGTFLLPLAGAVYGASTGHGGGFGWGKPVQWQPRNIRRGIKMATASILVAIAGPGMNLLLALVVAGVHALLVHNQVISLVGEPSKILFFATMTNFVLMFFNLLPVPPLDGGHVAASFTPYKYREQFESYAKFGPFIVLAVAMIPQIAQVFLIPAQFCTLHLYSLLGVL
jgi:Zn-dependent protease